MQKRFKMQKTLIAILALISSILIVSLIVGKKETAQVVIVNSEELDLNRSIKEQSDKFSVQQISLSDFNKFNGTLISSIDEVGTAKLKYKPAVGTPLTTSLITHSSAVGSFAAETPAFHTVFNLGAILSTVSSGLQRGDIIDIYLYIETVAADAANVSSSLLDGKDVSSLNGTINLLLSNVVVKDNSVNGVVVNVSQTEYNILYLAKKLGEFVVHLPGKKDVRSCDIVYDELKRSFETSLKDKMESKSYQNSSEEAKAIELRDLKNKYEYNIYTAECVSNLDKTDTISKEKILEKILNGESFDEILEDSNYADEFLRDDPFGGSIEDIIQPPIDTTNPNPNEENENKAPTEEKPEPTTEENTEENTENQETDDDFFNDLTNN